MRRNEAGLSLLELLGVLAIVAIAASVAAVSIARGQHTAGFRAAEADVRAYVTERISVSRRESRRVTISPAAELAGRVSGVTINPTDLGAPAGAEVAPSFDAVGGRPEVGGKQTAVAVVIATEARDLASAIVVERTGVVRVEQWTGASWERVE